MRTHLPILVAGEGLSALAVTKALARRGFPVTVLRGSARERTAPPWGLVPAALGSSLPPSAILEPALSVDIVLPTGLRIETPARLAVVDLAGLRQVWKRHARTAGARFHTGPSVRRTARAEGGVRGVLLRDGTSVPAALTIDATGEGALASAVYGAHVVGARAADREPIASARTALEPREVQSSWVGRAQLLLDIDTPGAMAWRCVSRNGRQLFAAATAGPGAMPEASADVLERAVGGVEPDLAWRPCRRPLDVMSDDGLLSLGGAAAMVDTLTGIDLPFVLRGVESFVRVLAAQPDGSLDKAGLFAASSCFLRGEGANLATRQLLRRFLHGCDPPERESFVHSGVLGAMVWNGAVQGDDLFVAMAFSALRSGRLPAPLRRRLGAFLRRCARMRAHYARYPRRYELFALETWQETAERLFGDPEK